MKKIHASSSALETLCRLAFIERVLLNHFILSDQLMAPTPYMAKLMAMDATGVVLCRKVLLNCALRPFDSCAHDCCSTLTRAIRMSRWQAGKPSSSTTVVYTPRLRSEIIEHHSQ